MIGPCTTQIRPERGRATPSRRAPSTRAPSPTRLTGAVVAADLPDLDLRAGRRRAAARRLRVRAQPEPDPRAAGAGGRRSRGRPARDRVRQSGRRRPRRSPSWRAPARRSSSATTSTAARSATSSGSTARPAPPRRRTRPRVGPRRAVGGADRADPPRLARVAVEPAAQGHRHRRRGGARPRPGRRRPARRRPCSWSTTRSRRRRSSDRSSWARTSCSTRRPSTWAGTRTRSSASPSPSTTRSRSGCGSCRTRWAACPGPFDCFLVLRGLRTLALRMERHSANAMAVARFLAARDDVAWVGYPGLGDGPHAHPGHAVAARQMRPRRGAGVRRHGLVHARGRRGAGRTRGGAGDRGLRVGAPVHARRSRSAASSR